MKELPKKEPQPTEVEQKLHASLSLEDFRAGHWPGTKTPPWMLNETWASKHAELKSRAEQMDWQEKNELLIATSIIQAEDESHEVDIYANRDNSRFGFVAYPKGRTFGDFWNEDGTEKETDEE